MLLATTPSSDESDLCQRQCLAGVEPKVVEYLTLYDETGDSPGAFKKVFDVDLSALQRQLESKVKKGRYEVSQFVPNQPMPQPVISVAAVSRTDARLALALALLRFPGGDKRLDQVRGFYDRVLADDPSNVGALVGLANVALFQREPALAASFLARIPEGKDERVLVARGDVALMQAARAGLSEPLLSEARERYLAALAINNRLAEAFHNYGLTYLGSTGDPKEGLAGFREAAALAPGDPEASFFHGLMLLQAGNFDEARRLGRQTVLGNREPEFVAFGNKLMEM